MAEKKVSSLKINEYGKAELTELVMEKLDLSKAKASAVIDAVFGAVQDLLVAGSKNADVAKITIRDFGQFETHKTKAREGRNFHTDEPLTIPASRRVSFSVAKGLKMAVKEVPVK